MERTIAVPGADREADCADALDYIRNLTAGDAKSAMTKYGRLLLVELPEETTQFAIELCAGYNGAEPDSNLEEYMDIFLGEKGRKQLTVFLERAKEQLEVSGVKLERQTTQKVNETLVELYLQTAQDSPERAGELHGKAMSLLEDMESSKVDSDHALVLCNQYDFNEGELHLLSERPGMHRQILEKYMAIDDDERLIEAVQKFAQLDETLWVDVLRYYSQKGNVAAAQIQELLSLIEAESALPPLMVVEALASGPDTSLEVCQDYLERQFSNDFAVVHEDRKESEKYKLDTAEAQKDMDDQLKANRRSAQGMAAGAMALTDSPTKYFLRAMYMPSKFFILPLFLGLCMTLIFLEQVLPSRACQTSRGHRCRSGGAHRRKRRLAARVPREAVGNRAEAGGSEGDAAWERGRVRPGREFLFERDVSQRAMTKSPTNLP